MINFYVRCNYCGSYTLAEQEAAGYPPLLPTGHFRLMVFDQPPINTGHRGPVDLVLCPPCGKTVAEEINAKYRRAP